MTSYFELQQTCRPCKWTLLCWHCLDSDLGVSGKKHTSWISVSVFSDPRMPPDCLVPSLGRAGTCHKKPAAEKAGSLVNGRLSMFACRYWRASSERLSNRKGGSAETLSSTKCMQPGLLSSMLYLRTTMSTSSSLPPPDSDLSQANGKSALQMTFS